MPALSQLHPNPSTPPPIHPCPRSLSNYLPRRWPQHSWRSFKHWRPSKRGGQRRLPIPFRRSPAPAPGAHPGSTTAKDRCWLHCSRAGTPSYCQAGGRLPDAEATARAMQIPQLASADCPHDRHRAQHDEGLWAVPNCSSSSSSSSRSSSRDSRGRGRGT
jgi:hypothetical protein